MKGVKQETNLREQDFPHVQRSDTQHGNIERTLRGLSSLLRDKKINR